MRGRPDQVKVSPSPPRPLRPLPRHPLPHPITALIGREEDVRDVVARITASRLVTLAGAGGVGKTRLAIEAAWAAADGFPAGAAFVALASLSDPALLPSFVATALGLREREPRIGGSVGGARPHGLHFIRCCWCWTTAST